ncbi:MAG: hypothetical protein AAFW95_15530, partial [Cyanobacteria bacterium J06638_6]
MIKRLLKSVGLGFDLPEIIISLVVVLLGLTVLLALLWGVAMSRGKWLKQTQPMAESLDRAGAWQMV